MFLELLFLVHAVFTDIFIDGLAELSYVSSTNLRSSDNSPNTLQLEANKASALMCLTVLNRLHKLWARTLAGKILRLLQSAMMCS